MRWGGRAAASEESVHLVIIRHPGFAPRLEAKCLNGMGWNRLGDRQLLGGAQVVVVRSPSLLLACEVRYPDRGRCVLFPWFAPHPLWELWIGPGNSCDAPRVLSGLGPGFSVPSPTSIEYEYLRAMRQSCAVPVCG